MSNEKKTLNAILREQEANLYNSNMANLASALTDCLANIQAHKDEIKRLEALSVEICNVSEDETRVRNTTEVKRLYDEVRKKIAIRNNSW